jgi:hypothetical protein
MNKLDRYFDAVATIRAKGTSADGWVTVTRAEDGTLDVQIRPGMLGRLDDRAIAEEIRTALLAAVADHRRQYVQLRVDHFGSPLGAAAAGPPEITTGRS